jgi:23S rRNA (uracil1939-C5)-methyltransferase
LANEILELDVERAVAGGRMLARHAGRIVFVGGAIPGERVRVRITKSSRQSLWADTIEVITPSPDRREPICDAACGGLAFAHIRYERQRALKSQILADAFRRLARMDLGAPEVAASPESGYRLRSRLHVVDGRLGFFLEGSHVLCDAAPTLQLRPESLEAARDVLAALGTAGANCESIVVSENVNGREVVVHLEPREGSRLDGAAPAVETVAASSKLTGITTVVRGRLVPLSGVDAVTDTALSLLGTDAGFENVRWTRRPTSFFQGNRYLAGTLVRRVLELAIGRRVADLYAGVGLFTVPLASRGGQVIAVEGDQSSSDDLSTNTAPWASSVRLTRGSIEEYLRRPPTPAPDAVIVDPPRTGMSADALDGLAGWGPRSVVYVSCDPPTLARDAARLAQHGFRLLSIEGLDLFPNTPHVETIAAFAKP